MSQPRYAGFPASVPGPRASARQKSLVHLALLGLVWLSAATSGVVFSEPAPVDALSIALTVLLPAAGLVLITPGHLLYLSLWLVAAAGAYLAATLSYDVEGSTIHTSVSLYLYAASFTLAAFMSRNPQRHMRLFLNGWTVAAVIAAALGFAGYFALFPGAEELFTRFGRMSGTFKDPNVFGPFLVPPMLYCLHTVLERGFLRALVPLSLAGFLALAVLLSFSRGAWFNLAFALIVYGVLAYALTPDERQRRRMLGAVSSGVVLAAGLAGFALQDDKIAQFLEERASLTQSYDVGPEGRFGGQAKALDLILVNPLGIGAKQFTPVYHPEEVHNVYLSMPLNAGWIGGGVYWIIVGLTLALGFRHLLKATEWRGLYLIAYAAFAANAAEGLIIDSDHWRHFYVLMAMVWGLMLAPRPAKGA